MTKSTLVKIIIITSVVVLAGGGYFTYQTFVVKKDTANSQNIAQTPKVKTSKEIAKSYVKVLDQDGKWSDDHSIYEHIGESGGNFGKKTVSNFILASYYQPDNGYTHTDTKGKNHRLFSSLSEDRNGIISLSLRYYNEGTAEPVMEVATMGLYTPENIAKNLRKIEGMTPLKTISTLICKRD